MPNRGGFSWKRATGITKQKQKISRATGIPLSRSGRQRKVGSMLTKGCGCFVFPAVALVLAIIALTLFLIL